MARRVSRRLASEQLVFRLDLAGSLGLVDWIQQQVLNVRVSLEVLDHVWANRHYFFVKVEANVSERVTNQDGSKALAAVLWVYLGVHKVKFAVASNIVRVANLFAV